jgi:hypothetical protein
MFLETIGALQTLHPSDLSIPLLGFIAEYSP